MCNCNPNITEEERYAQHVLLELPESSPERERRIKAGLSSQVCIDPCIVVEMLYLWSKNIITTGCCCGHNKPGWPPMVNVANRSIDAMLQLGYVQEHYDPERKDTFRLKMEFFIN